MRIQNNRQDLQQLLQVRIWQNTSCFVSTGIQEIPIDIIQFSELDYHTARFWRYNLWRKWPALLKLELKSNFKRAGQYEPLGFISSTGKII